MNRNLFRNIFLRNENKNSVQGHPRHSALAQTPQQFCVARHLQVTCRSFADGGIWAQPARFDFLVFRPEISAEAFALVFHEAFPLTLAGEGTLQNSYSPPLILPGKGATASDRESQNSIGPMGKCRTSFELRSALTSPDQTGEPSRESLDIACWTLSSRLMPHVTILK